MYRKRVLEQQIQKHLALFPAIGIMGPRQSGKTTTVMNMFGNEYEYINLDDIMIRNRFHSDPQKFLSRYHKKVIFDEVQYLPELFPLLKTSIDADRSNYGRFVLTGSGQFLLGKHFSESLAGRIGLLSLLPLQFSELPDDAKPDAVFKGSYPELVFRNYTGSYEWYSSYFNTYIQKDLKILINILDLELFTTFIRILAANVGQPLNLSSVSRDIGVSVPTLSRWISVLEQSYIIFLLRPYYKNLGKRLIKSPKIYFYDTGLLAWLTGIATSDQYEQGILYGAIFENYVISEVLKRRYHHNLMQNLFYFRSSNGEEIDMVIEEGLQARYYEIKASFTYKPEFHRVVNKLGLSPSEFSVIYRGKTNEVFNEMIAWNYTEYLQQK